MMARLFQRESSDCQVRQLMLTSSHKLCIAFRRYYDRLCRAQAENLENQQNVQDMSELDMTTLTEGVQAEILSFADHTNTQSPVFITFRQLLDCLGQSIENIFTSKSTVIVELLKRLHLPLTLRLADRRGEEISFARFSVIYWPRMNETLRKGLSTVTLYTEIMSVIKGAVLALHSPQGHLTEEEYCCLSSRKWPPAKVRPTVFELFKQYQQLSAQYDDFDELDRIHYLYCELSKADAPLHRFDAVYIDEVQDLVPAALVLLQFVGTSFMFAGDTAQTIARGVNFSFADLRDLVYKEFDRGNDQVSPMPKVQQLLHNYRTHTGVLAFANDIIELLVGLFLGTIDKLQPEHSSVYGDQPTFLKTTLMDDLFTGLFGGAGCSQTCDFGADQVILVRSEDVKRALAAHLPGALILTIAESKGLEFNDVLVFNFWMDSQLKNEWRVLTNMQLFNETKHALLCGELKQLYVAVTRARQNSWFFDQDIKTRDPVLSKWESQGIVQLVTDLDNCQLGHTSTNKEWCARGIALFHQELFGPAQMCFQKGADQQKELWAKAAGLRHRAQNGKAPVLVWNEAAEIFLEINRTVDAIGCFECGGCFERAAELSMLIGDPKRAAELLSAVSRWNEAANAFVQANELQLALTACDSGELFDLGLDILRTHDNGQMSILWDDYVLKHVNMLLTTQKEEEEEPEVSFMVHTP